MSGRAARAAKRRKFKTLTQLLAEVYAEAVAQQVRLMHAWETAMVNEGKRLHDGT